MQPNINSTEKFLWTMCSEPSPDYFYKTATVTATFESRFAVSEVVPTPESAALEFY